MRLPTLALLAPGFVACSLTPSAHVSSPRTLRQVLRSEALNAVDLPPVPEVGQAWTIDWNGVITTYAIVARTEQHFVVEEVSSIYSDGVILAYLVDPDIDPRTAIDGRFPSNVLAAWAGAAATTPLQRSVRRPDLVADLKGVEGAKRMCSHLEVSGSFSTLRLGGRDWLLSWFELGVPPARYWELDGFTLRITREGRTRYEVIEWRTDAAPALRWTVSHGLSGTIFNCCSGRELMALRRRYSPLGSVSMSCSSFSSTAGDSSRC